MSPNRRAFFSRLAAAGSLMGVPGLAKSSIGKNADAPHLAEFEAPDSPKLPWVMKGGRKEFHLTAGVVRTEFIPGRAVDAWGYNGTVPGPVIEAYEGDRVRVVVENHLPETTSMHWHGLELPIGMDGVPGVIQDPIPPGSRFVYEFDLHQNGTFFYHSHMPMQEMMGMIGFFVIHPRVAHSPAVDKDFGLILQEWSILPNNTVPNTMAMEYNWLTMNGKAGPATTPLIARLGDRVRIRLVNLGMDHHPIHLHGNTFVITGSEGGRIPESAWAPGNTVLVAVAQARDLEFDAKFQGDWMLHCHMPHHGMNQMVSLVGPMMRRGSMEGMHGMPGMSHQTSPLVPGYPQDMWMVVDQDYASKPECYGLRAGWTGGMMGMMTLVRVLPPDLYDHIQALRKRAGGHHHEG